MKILNLKYHWQELSCSKKQFGNFDWRPEIDDRALRRQPDCKDTEQSPTGGLENDLKYVVAE